MNSFRLNKDFTFLRLTRSFSSTHGRISKGVLEGSSSDAKPREISPHKHPRAIIFTLDPNKFLEKGQQPLHIGALQYFTLQISLHKQSSPVRNPPLHYDDQNGRRVPFPPDTKAFLYYSMSLEKPRIAGELRLRVTSSDDAASFESGSDLLRLNGRPWSRLLPFLSLYNSPLYEKLREERLVPDDLDRVLSTSISNVNSYYRGVTRLYTLNDPFIVDFSKKALYSLVITEKAIEKMVVMKKFVDQRKKCKAAPYTGSALVRFERSTLLEHKGTRTVVLRYLKIITPVKCVIPLYDGHIPCPKEGELYQQTRVEGHPKVWSVNIDKSPNSLTLGLQLLWNA